MLDPIHFGFADSLGRYREVRARLPEAEMLMGTGNLTELTDADSVGVTAVLLGICSELGIANVLTVHVSPHTRRTIQEHDAARRIMYAAAADRSLPKGYGRALLQVHDRSPFPNSSEEIAELAAQVKDDNFRVETAEDGIHVYNRAGHFVSEDAFALFDKLGVETDGAHAFYLGAELMKAEIAFRLGKRYAQDEPLDWGCGADRRVEDDDPAERGGPHLARARCGPIGHGPVCLSLNCRQGGIGTVQGSRNRHRRCSNTGRSPRVGGRGESTSSWRSRSIRNIASAAHSMHAQPASEQYKKGRPGAAFRLSAKPDFTQSRSRCAACDSPQRRGQRTRRPSSPRSTAPARRIARSW